LHWPRRHVFMLVLFWGCCLIRVRMEVLSLADKKSVVHS